MADQRILYTERMVGAGHPTLADTLNRLSNVEHNTDGTHKMGTIQQATDSVNGIMSSTDKAKLNAIDLAGTGVGQPYIKFDLGATGAPSSEGTVNWNNSDNCLEFKTGLGNVVQIGKELGDSGVNKTGGTVSDGQVVYASGAQGGKMEFSYADAREAAKCSFVGVVTYNTANNAEGPVTSYGAVRNLDTSGWAEGTKLYVAANATGNLTNIAPSTPNFRIWVATVTYSHSVSGEIFVDPKLDFTNGITLTSLDVLTSCTLPTNTSIGSVNYSEISYLDGVTSAIQTQLGGKQPLDATLTAIAGVTTAADKLIYATGVDTFSTTTLTSTARSLLDDTTTTAMRTTLGLGTAATTAATDYAVAAKGVTNGDAHDHTGGDGAAISLVAAVTGILPVLNGGTGSDIQNFVDLTTDQTIAGNKTLTGTTTIPLGTAAAPSLAFAGDPDTGVYSPGGGSISLATQGVERLRIGNGGTLAVGPTGPITDSYIFNTNATLTHTTGIGATAAVHQYNHLIQPNSALTALYGWLNFPKLTNSVYPLDTTANTTYSGNYQRLDSDATYSGVFDNVYMNQSAAPAFSGGEVTGGWYGLYQGSVANHRIPNAFGFASAQVDTPVQAITSITRASNVVTATFASNTIGKGISIEITGCTDSSFNGTFTTTLADATTLTWAQTAADATSSGGQTNPGTIVAVKGKWGIYCSGTANNYLLGNTGIGTIPAKGRKLSVSGTITGSAGSAYSILSGGTAQPDVTYWYVNGTAIAQAAGGAITNLHHFNASQSTISGTITTQVGFAVNATLIAGTNNYGFRGQIPSGTGRYNLYMDGTAQNYMLGETGIGALPVVGQGALQVTGGIKSDNYKLSDLNTAPASATATGTLGEIRWGADYMYVCVATNTWKRSALTTW